jgi:predicted O-methyltransferase YrrM
MKKKIIYDFGSNNGDDIPYYLLKSDLVIAVEANPALCDDKRNYFDFIYIDGAHKAPQVLFDAVAAFRLTKIGGYIAFDDYLWSEKLPNGKDLLRCPKPAIDAFTNLYCQKLNILSAPLYQLYIQKISD